MVSKTDVQGIRDHVSMGFQGPCKKNVDVGLWGPSIPIPPVRADTKTNVEPPLALRWATLVIKMDGKGTFTFLLDSSLREVNSAVVLCFPHFLLDFLGRTTKFLLFFCSTLTDCDSAPLVFDQALAYGLNSKMCKTGRCQNCCLAKKGDQANLQKSKHDRLKIVHKAIAVAAAKHFQMPIKALEQPLIKLRTALSTPQSAYLADLGPLAAAIVLIGYH
ncbi:hypothetical protein VNO77_14937 [Canavalia gladiata]|uniref:Uncharacterized protein n=1 Tax=Canavalia gladiata TaxID=3824 RepID=A0AAN9LZ82_CANGL